MSKGCMEMSEYHRFNADLNPVSERCPKSASASPVCVAGAVNLDLSGTPYSELIPADSNPGKVRITPGGVGRNIAENLSRLGHRVSMVTALGSDPGANLIRESCRSLGIGLSLSLTVPDLQTSTYLCINGPDGDIRVAVSDMEICSRITPAVLESRLPAMNSAPLTVVDANLPENSIEFLCRRLRCAVAADPVSVSKAGRLKKVLPFLQMVKPNVPEAELLSGVPIRSDADIPLAAEALVAAGVKWVFISLGSRGVYASDGRSSAFLPCIPSDVRNTTGCGDAFLAAAADAWLHRLPVLDAAQAGLCAAALCAESDLAVSPVLTHDFLQSKLKGVSLQ